MLPWAGGPDGAGEHALPLTPMGSLGHSPEALQEGPVAQSLGEHGQAGAAQWEMAEAGRQEARGGLGMAEGGSQGWTEALSTGGLEALVLSSAQGPPR